MKTYFINFRAFRFKFLKMLFFYLKWFLLVDNLGHLYPLPRAFWHLQANENRFFTWSMITLCSLSLFWYRTLMIFDSALYSSYDLSTYFFVFHLVKRYFVIVVLPPWSCVSFDLSPFVAETPRWLVHVL